MRNTFSFQDPSPYIANHAPFWEAIIKKTLCLDNKKYLYIYMLCTQDCQIHSLSLFQFDNPTHDFAVTVPYKMTFSVILG